MNLAKSFFPCSVGAVPTVLVKRAILEITSLLYAICEDTHLGIHDMCHTFNTFHILQGFEKSAPSRGFAATTWTDHHKTMVNLRYLVQLKDLPDKNRTKSIESTPYHFEHLHHYHFPLKNKETLSNLELFQKA